MNLDSFWQTHRRFLTGIACGLLVFLIGQLLIAKTVGASATSASSTLRTSNRTLRNGGFGAPQVRELQEQVDALRARSKELAEQTLPPWRDAFQPRPGQEHRSFYISFTGQRRAELVSYALRSGMSVDERLGLPAISPADPPTIERALRGFDLVDRLVNLGVQLGVRAMEDIEILTRNTSQRTRQRQGLLLDLTPVTLEVQLAENLIDPFLEQLYSMDPPFGISGVQLLPADKRKKERVLHLEFMVGKIPEHLLEEGK